MKELYSGLINKLLGLLEAVTDDRYLYKLQFVDREFVAQEKFFFAQDSGVNDNAGNGAVFEKIKNELELYFEGKLRAFITPVFLTGSDFRKAVLRAVYSIAYGETVSYKAIAQTIGYSQAYRAVGNTNKANELVIIVPCHRVIKSDGELGGYSAGLER